MQLEVVRCVFATDVLFLQQFMLFYLNLLKQTTVNKR